MIQKKNKQKTRCAWVRGALMEEYHDTEWGRPLHDDAKLFEFLILESFQAGLSWAIVLKKRENFRRAFANFDAKKIARFSDAKIEKLMGDVGIIRNRLKIVAVINNAKRFLEIQKESSSFDKYVWSFTKRKTVYGKRKSLKDVPAKTDISDMMSRDMGKRGFKFRGSTICYAFMQAIGIAHDHTKECFLYKEK